MARKLIKPAAPAVITHSLALPEHIQRQREQWQARAIIATKGNQSHLGRIFLAVLGRAPSNPPRFSIEQGAVILDDYHAKRLGINDGDVLADFQAKPDAAYVAIRVGHIDEIVDNFRGLADAIKLTDGEREAMFMMLRQWIRKDFRATSSTEVGERGETDVEPRKH